MMTGTQKVWVIDPPEPVRRKPEPPRRGKPDGRAMPQYTISAPSSASPPPVSPAPSRIPTFWSPLLTAYLFGPIAVYFWLERRHRLEWTILGGVSVLATAMLVPSWSPVADWLVRHAYGAHAWAALLALVAVTLATVWARAIAAAARHRASPDADFPGWVRDPRVAAVLGLIVPGFGLMLAGHRRWAALAFWIVGPLAAAAIVLTRWRWLWASHQSSQTAATAGTALEVTLVLAACVVVAALLAWVVQALDGARRAWTTPSPWLANAASVALLFSLGLFFLAFRPAVVARDFHTTAVTLRADGFRVIPLGLCEMAARLDPATPAYLADAAVLNRTLGMRSAADAKKDLLKQRLGEYVAVAGKEAGIARPLPVQPIDPRPALAARPNRPSDTIGAYTRILDLSR